MLNTQRNASALNAPGLSLVTESCRPAVAVCSSESGFRKSSVYMTTAMSPQLAAMSSIRVGRAGHEFTTLGWMDPTLSLSESGNVSQPYVKCVTPAHQSSVSMAVLPIRISDTFNANPVPAAASALSLVQCALW